MHVFNISRNGTIIVNLSCAVGQFNNLAGIATSRNSSLLSTQLHCKFRKEIYMCSLKEMGY